jgi:ABC-type nitrate/sulfonate/bicarbonate transport system permease component
MDRLNFDGTIAAARSPGKTQLRALYAGGLIGVFALWQALAMSGAIPATFLPSPVNVLRMLIELQREPYSGDTLLGHLGSSLGRFAMGFALAVATGIPLGLAMGWYRRLDYLVSPVFDAVRFVAPVAWVPFAALWFGTGIGGPVLIIFIGAFGPCVVNAYRGARQVDKTLIEAARMLGAPGWRLLGEVVLRASLPSCVAGVRLAAGIGWQALVAAELIVAARGIGYLMVQGQMNIDTSIVMAGMIVIGAIGLLMDLALRWLETRIRREQGER